MIKSTDSPRHPAACLVFRAADGLKSVGFFCAAFLLCTTFPLNTVSYRARAAGGTGVGRESTSFVGPALLALCVELEVWEVAVLRMEERSEVEEREGGAGGGALRPIAVTTLEVDAGEIT